MTNEIAPIVLFVYNRPWHTEQTLEALSANALADQSVLYIFSDGPKANASAEEIAKIEHTRAVLRKRKWCKEVHVRESPINKGLADSIVSGVTEVINLHGSVIVMEDDLVASIGFLRFMNCCLDLYQNDDGVMHISGYMFPVRARLPEIFFYKQTSCWGWATWKRAWDLLNLDSLDLMKQLHQRGKLREADIDGTNQFVRQLKQNINGSISTWAVKWQFTVMLNDGLCLHPGRSLVRNIGLDGSGANSGMSTIYDSVPTEDVKVSRIPIVDYKPIYSKLRSFYKSAKGGNVRSHNFWMLPFKRAIKFIVDSGYRYQIVERRRLRQLPRFTATTTKLFDREISIVDTASYLFTKNEIFDRHIYKFKTFSESPYIIDCGANIGLSVIYFRKLYNKADILAFEPDVKICKVLESNLRAFGHNDVRVVNKALWDEETTLNFFSEGADAGKIVNGRYHKNSNVVETVRLRQFLNRQVDFLKIDIEGAEVRVLRDCRDLLHLVDRLFVEYHSFVSQDQELDELLCILRQSGFRYLIQQHGVVSNRPFISTQTQEDIDIVLNISAFRNR